jgi:hypothetical protein
MSSSLSILFSNDTLVKTYHIAKARITEWRNRLYLLREEQQHCIENMHTFWARKRIGSFKKYALTA